jgi:HSP20 family molecular chaperone IbpA
MKSQQAKQAEVKTDPTKLKPQAITIVEAKRLLDRMKEIYEAVENRAYELFAERDYESGHNLEDWLIAEAELLTPPPQVQVVETESQIIVMATIAELSKTSLNIGALPKRLILNGAKERSAGQPQDRLTREKGGREFFVLLALPDNIEPANIKARSRGDRLELTLPRKNGESET